MDDFRICLSTLIHCPCVFEGNNDEPYKQWYSPLYNQIYNSSLPYITSSNLLANSIELIARFVLEVKSHKNVSKSKSKRNTVASIFAD